METIKFMFSYSYFNSKFSFLDAYLYFRFFLKEVTQQILHFSDGTCSLVSAGLSSMQYGKTEFRPPKMAYFFICFETTWVNIGI